MKKYNQVEVILFTQYLFRDINQKELIKWLGTTVQSVIGRQETRVKKMYPTSLKNTPPIYLS